MFMKNIHYIELTLLYNDYHKDKPSIDNCMVACQSAVVYGRKTAYLKFCFRNYSPYMSG